MNREQLQAIVRDAREKLSAIETAERIASARSFVGLRFKYRNCYSCPEKPSDYWWLYLVITRMDTDGALYGFEFQRDKHGEIAIRPDKIISTNGAPMAGYQECRIGEFEAAWKGIVDSLPAIPGAPR